MSFLGHKKNDGLSAGVHFKHTEKNDRATYHVHSGPNQQAALAFLRSTPIRDEFVYNIVETPEGNFGRDLIYLFREADGTPIEFAERPQNQSPTSSSTRCAWCGFVVVPCRIPLNDEMDGTVQVYRTYDELMGLLKTGGGFCCRSCSLLQCAVCSGLARAEGKAREPVCLACGGKVSVQEEVGPVGRSNLGKLAKPDDKNMLTLPSDPLGDELWGMAPLRVPWSIDVPSFLSRGNLPYLWPDDNEYMGYIGSGERAQGLLRPSWINVFLHHPNPDVVLQCLRSAPPDSMLTLNALADLLASPIAESHVKEEAARAFWRLGDGMAAHTLNVLLSRGMVPSGYDTNSVHQALGHLRTACPPERAGWFEIQLAGPDDD
ncbi:hypothetical protein OG936_35030 [Streptomyces sp. NBC_00846]|uniref:hypothetical protein n=1 Tax=Streptomyces sp. NBC_00846 TaxID=2975849 RepID=UPI003863B62F|nr:hypothetical protein OG936_35030 [Streptomyces sp. NBC_00846]